LCVNRVHLGEFIHIIDEDVDLDDLVNRRAGGFENGAQVLDALVLFGAIGSGFWQIDRQGR
jgi:hypothetical protein